MNPLKIAIVEDESIIALELEDRLLRMGYHVAGAAGDSDTALNLIAEKRPDVVLMDIRINGTKDGIETGAEVHKKFGIPIIFLTAYADNATVERAKVTQPYGYLTKPFREHELRATIEMAIVRQQMEKRLLESERLALLGRLLGAVSHELNNPLQTIQNTLFLLQDEAEFSAPNRQKLDLITAEARRMSYMITFLRDSHKPIDGETFSTVQFNELVNTMCGLTDRYMSDMNVSWKFEPAEDLPPIRGLREHLQQLLLNLIMNAIDSMPTGGRLSIRTGFSAVDDLVILSVADTGAGIPDEMLVNVFEPFMTQKPTSTGLGLSIARQIVLKHGGTIRAENAAQGGAIFTIHLPGSGL